MAVFSFLLGVKKKNILRKMKEGLGFGSRGPSDHILIAIQILCD